MSVDHVFSYPYRDGVFKGIDAHIRFSKSWDGNRDVIKYDWIGGQLAAISNEFMSEIIGGHGIGDHFSLGDLQLLITDYSPIGEFWYVRRVQ